MSTPSRIALVVIAVFLAGLSSRDAFAQAWVGQGGALSVSLDYSYGRSDRIIADYANRDQEPTTDNISNHNTVLSAEYTPIDKLGLQAAIPIVTSIYSGEALRPRHGRYDDGDYHTTLQDFRLTGRYMVLDDPLAFSPHLGVSVPMADYETVGYAGAGRGLKQLHVGASIGKYFLSGVPNLYLHGTYEFSLVERYETGFPDTSDYGQNRSDIKALVGYFITDRFEAHIGGDWRIAHGGLQFQDWVEGNISPEAGYFHDALLAENFLLLGGGLSYQLMETLRLSAFFRLWMWGENTRDSNMVGMGIGWDVM